MGTKVIYEKGGFSLEDMDGPADFSEMFAPSKDKPNYLKLVGREQTGLMVPEEGYNQISNREIFKLYAIVPKMIDARLADISFNLFGKSLKTPILCSAISSLGTEMMKELATGFRDAGSVMGVGISSQKQLEEVLSIGAPTIKYVKPYRDFDLLMKKAKHAEAAGAIAVGCDVIYGFGAKFGEKVFLSEHLSPLSQKQLEKLVKSVSVPFIVKGVLSVQDAIKAKEAGAKGIVVSNHSGLVLDYCVHPLEVLPEIRAAVGKEMVIFADSGFRRGTDVFKALALGADAVLLGFILINPLQTAGSNGVRDLINILSEELQRVMSLTGCVSLEDIDQGAIFRRGYCFPG
jgi:isopentenyl diphosphate isomerase/L-lactate dehydrogenase-like FMN-dependent dehydrogenase